MAKHSGKQKQDKDVDPRLEQIAHGVSEAIKMHGRWRRYDVAKKFARKMREAAQRVTDYGCMTAGEMGEGQKMLGRAVINAMCWGVGDERNVKMIARYEAAAKAAERFMRR